MKTAIYIEDGVTQLVLTPESEFEKNLISGMGERLDRVQVFQGTFYDCRGGWVRQTAVKMKASSYEMTATEDASLILKVDSRPTAKEEQEYEHTVNSG